MSHQGGIDVQCRSGQGRSGRVGTGQASAGEVGAVYQHLADVGYAFRERVRLTPAGSRAHLAAGVTVGDLGIRPALAAGLVDAARALLEREHAGLVPRYVAATRVLHDYAWPVCLLVSGPWFLEGLVPDLTDEDVAVDPDTGLHYVGSRGAVRCEAGGGAGEGGARAAEVRRVVADHHAPLLEALGPHLRRGVRAAWGTVSDDLVSGLWWLGRLVGDEVAGVRSGTELLLRPATPFPGVAAFRTIVATDGGEHVTRTRVACCLKYVVEEQACLTCPRTGDAERRTRLVGC